MAAGTPTVLAPHAGTYALNWREAICLRKSPFVDGSPPSTTDEDKPCTTDLDGNWSNPARFSTGAGFMDDMASASAVGKANHLGFSGLNFTAGTGKVIKELRLALDYMADWSTPPGYAGDAFLRVLFAYKRATRATFLCPTPATEWTNAHTPPVDTASFDVLPIIREILDKRWVTIGDLEGIAADLTVCVAAAAEGSSSVVTYYAGPLRFSAKYYTTTAALTQIGVHWQVASETVGPTVVWQSEVANDDDVLWIPSQALPGGSTLYFRVRVKGDNGVYSSWSAWVTATTMGTAAAGLLRGVANQVLIADFRARMWIDGARWRVGGSNSNDWWIDLVRGVDFPLVPFWIHDIAENGLPSGYTERFTGGFNPGEWAYPFSGLSRLWVHTLDGRPPSGFADGGIHIILGFGLATKNVLAGPGDTFEYRGLILNEPGLADDVDDVITGHGSTGSAALELDNADGYLFTLLSGINPDAGLLLDRAAVELSYVGVGPEGLTTWANRLRLWSGECVLPTAIQLDQQRVSVPLVPMRERLSSSFRGTRRYSSVEYKNLRELDLGAVMPEFFGTFNEGWIKCAIVDKTGRILRAAVTMSVPQQLAVTMDGGTVAINFGTSTTGPAGGAAWWSFNTTTSEITILSGGYATFDADIQGEWRCKSNVGEQLDNSNSGNIAENLLLKAGFTAVQIDSASFDAFTGVCHLYVDQPTPAADLVRMLRRRGGFGIIDRPDGVMEAVATTPTYPDEHTMIVDSSDVIGLPKFSVSREHMAATASLTYHDPTDLGSVYDFSADYYETKVRQAHGVYPKARAIYGISREVAEPTAASALPAAWEEYRAAFYAGSDQPYLHVELSLPLRFALVQPGRTVALSLATAMLPRLPSWWPAGVARRFEWELCLVVRRKRTKDGVQLTVRWLSSLPPSKRPL